MRLGPGPYRLNLLRSHAWPPLPRTRGLSERMQGPKVHRGRSVIASRHHGSSEPMQQRPKVADDDRDHP